MQDFYVIKKNAECVIKTPYSEEKARKFASDCCTANQNDDYFVAVYKNGVMMEI